MRLHAAALLVAILTVLVLAFATPGAALQPTPDGGWYWQEPQPGGTWFSDVASADGRSGWAVANYGVVLSTRDGGLTWNAQISGTTADLEAVTAVDDLTAFAVGSVSYGATDRSAVLLRTTDGGSTWEQRGIGGPGFNPAAIEFADAQHGWVGGADAAYRSAVYATADGGLSWTRQSLSGHGLITCVEFCDAEHGWAGDATNTVYRTTDGGATWKGATVNAYEVGRIATVSSSDVWVLADGDPGWVPCRKLFHSRDGGRTFERVLPGIAAAGGASALIFDADGVGMVAGGSYLWRTTDAGATWTRRFTGADIWSLAGRASGSLFATNPHSVLVSPDGGRCWPSALGGLRLGWVMGLEALPGHAGWMLASGPWGVDTTYRVRLFRCDDGLRWQALKAVPWAEALDFADAGHGIVVGSRGRALVTADGGATWRLSEVGDGYRLTSVNVLTDQVAWIAGHDLAAHKSAVWHTIDGGQSWSKRALPADVLPADMSFVDDAHGWIAGAEGEGDRLSPGHVLRTGDGGLTWSDVTPSQGEPGSFGAIEFTDAVTGWVLITNRYPTGSSGVLHTSDGGATWLQTKGAIWSSVGDVDFWDADHGYIVGDPSYRTDDGGLTWNVVTLPGDASEVSMAVDGSGLAGSREGVLLSSWDQAGDATSPQTACETEWRWRRTTVSLSMASVDPGGSGVAHQEYAVDQEAVWQQGDVIVVPAPADHSNDGLHTVYYRAVDNAGNAGIQSTWAGIDTRGPVTAAPRAAAVRRGDRVKLAFRVNDALSDTARVSIDVVDSAGRCRATLRLGSRRTSVRLAASLDCRLPRGRYTFRVLAVDRAGNEQRRIGANSLRVF